MAAALAIGGQAAILAAPQSPRISTGDQLKIVVANIDMGATEFTVDTEGTINYPYLGKIKVAAMTSTELAAKVGAGALIDRDEGAHQNREDDGRDRDREPGARAGRAKPACEALKHRTGGDTQPT